MRYLTAHQLLLIHSRLIDQTGGSGGVRDKARIESVIEAPKQAVFGTEQYKGTFSKAAVYIHNIIHDHPFIDGNKRVAMLAGLTFLEQNGYIVSFEKGSIEEKAVEVATQKLAIDHIADWLKENSSRR